MLLAGDAGMQEKEEEQPPAGDKTVAADDDSRVSRVTMTLVPQQHFLIHVCPAVKLLLSQTTHAPT